jgi:hypothetical protein
LLKRQLAYSFVLLGVFMSEKNTSSSRKFFVNDLNNFCYICGKYCQQLQRRNITDFVKQAYEAYFFPNIQSAKPSMLHSEDLPVPIFTALSNVSYEDV